MNVSEGIRVEKDESQHSTAARLLTYIAVILLLFCFHAVVVMDEFTFGSGDIALTSIAKQGVSVRKDNTALEVSDAELVDTTMLRTHVVEGMKAPIHGSKGSTSQTIRLEGKNIVGRSVHRGMNNIEGYLCYINAAMHFLFMNKGFVEFLEQLTSSMEKNDALKTAVDNAVKAAIEEALKKGATGTEEPTGISYKPMCNVLMQIYTDLVDNTNMGTAMTITEEQIAELKHYNKQFNNENQQDVHEFILHVFQHLDLEWRACEAARLNKSLSAYELQATPLDSIFASTQRIKVSCTVCNTAGEIGIVTARCILLGHCNSAQEAANALAWAMLEDAECVKCAKKKRFKVQTSEFTTLSRSLILYRTTFDWSTAGQAKRHGAMTFTFQLDMMNTVALDIEKNIHDHTYRLIGFISRLGSGARSGHFIAYILEDEPTGNRWVEYNDTRVTQVTPDGVLQQASLTGMIFMYERITNISASSESKISTTTNAAAADADTS
jgi:uncharacterized UBP type Zn finger protein